MAQRLVLATSNSGNEKPMQGLTRRCSALDDELAFWQGTGSDDLTMLALTPFTWNRRARRFVHRNNQFFICSTK